MATEVLFYIVVCRDAYVEKVPVNWVATTTTADYQSTR